MHLRWYAVILPAKTISLAVCWSAVENEKRDLVDISRSTHRRVSVLRVLLNQDRGDAYRALYQVKLAGSVCVLQRFQKTSTNSIETPKQT